MENFVLPIFAAIRRNWTKNGQKQDGIRTGKNARKRDSRTRLLDTEKKAPCEKMKERHFLRPRYIEWRVWKRRGVEPMERKPDIDDLIFGDERPISQR